MASEIFVSTGAGLRVEVGAGGGPNTPLQVLTEDHARVSFEIELSCRPVLHGDPSLGLVVDAQLVPERLARIHNGPRITDNLDSVLGVKLELVHEERRCNRRTPAHARLTVNEHAPRVGYRRPRLDGRVSLLVGRALPLQQGIADPSRR